MKTLTVNETRNINGGADFCYNGAILSYCGGQPYTTCGVCKKRFYGFGCMTAILWHSIWTGHMR